MHYAHLRTGTTLFPHDDTLLLVAPDEAFAAITGEDLTAVAEVLRGHSPIPAAGLAAEATAGALEWGVAATGPVPPERPPVPAWPEPHDAAAAAHRLADATTHLVRPVLSGVLDDEALRMLDADPPAEAWLPIHRELGALVAGPVLGTATGLSWSDVRFRRLAASPTPVQLEALWRHWSERGASHDVRPTDAAVTEAMERLAGWLGAHPGVIDDHQVVLPIEAGSTPTTHPVLAVPSGLMEKMPA